MLSTDSEPRFLLIDCNNFFASCERVFRPDLASQPIVVLSNNDGCIIARSQEAKKLGIKMGEPMFKVAGLLKAHHVATFSANFSLYGALSNRVMETIESIVGDIEQYSIDECFVKLQAAHVHNVNEIAYEIKNRVRQWVGIPVSVGIGSTRTLAKLACHIAKHRTGVFSFPKSSTAIDDLLAQIHVSEVWGVGGSTERKLAAVNIKNCSQLKNADNNWIRRNLNITGLHTVLELRGIPCIEDVTVHIEARKSILTSRSFGQKIYDLKLMEGAITEFVSRAAMRLRRGGLLAQCLSVYIRTSKFSDPVTSDFWQTKLSRPSNDTSIFLQAALRGLHSIFKSGFPYAKAGVQLFNLSSAKTRQGNLLDLNELQHDCKREALMLSLDRINTRYGQDKIHYGSIGNSQPWRMKQECLSPNYLSDWKSLAEAKCLM